MKSNRIVFVLISSALLIALGGSPLYAQDSQESQSSEVVEVSADAAPEQSEEGGDESEMLEVRTIAKKSDQLLNSLVTISGKQLEEENVTSISDAILLIPGAVPEFGSGAVTRVSIDGLSPSRITVMRDGIPIGRITSHPRGSAYDYGQKAIDPNAIERMEITRGIGPNGSNGIVINLITKRKDVVRASVTGRYAQALPGNDSKEKGFLATSYRRELMGDLELPIAAFFNPNSSVPRIVKELNLLTSLGYRNDAAVSFRQFDKKELISPKGPDTKDWTRPTNPAIENFYGDVQLSWNRAANYLVAGVSFDVTRVNTEGKFPEYPRVSYTDIDEYRLYLNGKWNHSLGYVTNSTSFKGFHRQSDAATISQKGTSPRTTVADTKSKFFNQSLDAVFMLGAHDVSVSGSFNGEWTTIDGRAGNLDGGLISNSSIGLGEHWYINREWDLEAQVRGILQTSKNQRKADCQEEILVGGKPAQPAKGGKPAVKAVPGKPSGRFKSVPCKVADSRETQEDFVRYLPNYDFTLKASWKPTKHYLARLVGGRSVMPLTAEQSNFYFRNPTQARVIIQREPNLKPEEMYTAKGEFGVRYNWIAVTYSPFFHYIDNYVLTVKANGGKPGQANYTIQNLDKPVYFFGMNVIAEINLPYNINIEGNYTYLPIAKMTEDYEKKRGNKADVSTRISLRPEHAYHVEVNGRWFDSKLGARVWVDGRSKLPVPGKGVTSIGTIAENKKDWQPAVAVVSLGLDYSPEKWISIGLEASNITNVVNPYWGPIVGRYVMATLTLRQEGNR